MAKRFCGLLVGRVSIFLLSPLKESNWRFVKIQEVSSALKQLMVKGTHMMVVWGLEVSHLGPSDGIDPHFGSLHD